MAKAKMETANRLIYSVARVIGVTAWQQKFHPSISSVIVAWLTVPVLKSLDNLFYLQQWGLVHIKRDSLEGFLCQWYLCMSCRAYYELDQCVSHSSCVAHMCIPLWQCVIFCGLNLVLCSDTFEWQSYACNCSMFYLLRLAPQCCAF